MDEKTIADWRGKIEDRLDEGAEAHEEIYEKIHNLYRAVRNLWCTCVCGFICVAAAIVIGFWIDTKLQVSTERLTAIGEATREHYEFQGRLLEQVLTRVEKNTPLLTRLLEKF